MVHPAHYDAVLARADRWLFGGRDPLPMLDPLVHPTLTEVLCCAYFCMWVPPVLLGVVLYRRGRDRELSDLLLGLVLIHCAGFAGYRLVPAVGPWYGVAGRCTVRLVLKVFGVGLALAVLLDCTVVRALLVPALMKLFGDANWWLPSLPAWARHRRAARPAPEPARPAEDLPAATSSQK
ncbi:phosphatase PAP2 family protein [Streptomyces sp. NPDC006309]|uniref:phosphatase PAP2 family protein n=1 Tax=Streptomyces sp. NPDC006309 TaxID=3156749 RepID=UPI0033BE9377